LNIILIMLIFLGFHMVLIPPSFNRQNKQSTPSCFFEAFLVPPNIQLDLAALFL
jgi:hypothetical protein